MVLVTLLMAGVPAVAQEPGLPPEMSAPLPKDLAAQTYRAEEIHGAAGNQDPSFHEERGKHEDGKGRRRRLPRIHLSRGVRWSGGDPCRSLRKRGG